MDEYLKSSLSDKGREGIPITTRKVPAKPLFSYPRMVCLALAGSFSLGMVSHLRPSSFSAELGSNYPDIDAGHEISLQEPGAPFAPKDIQRLWGYLAPYHAVQKYESPPPGCTVKQVNILHRHGARFPEVGDQEATMKAVQNYQRAEGYNAPELQFLKNYSYDLGSDDLVEFGGEQ